MDESISKVIGENSVLLLIYSATKAKYVLESKDRSKNINELKYNSFLIFIQYCENENNNLKQTKEIKKLIEAKNNGTLREYLKTQ